LDRAVEGKRSLRGEIRVPGDKSISHRALMLASLADGESVLRGLSTSRDVGSTFGALESIGVDMERYGDRVRVRGEGISGFELKGKGPAVEVDCGNSGTTARLLTGLLAGARIRARLFGDSSLSKRPMMRVIDPFSRFGARIEHNDGRLPILLLGGRLGNLRYTVPVPSAQVKTALLFASIFVEGTSMVDETVLTRDHTERLFSSMNAAIVQTPLRSGKRMTVTGRMPLFPLNLKVPGDISTAIFYIVSALVTPRSRLVVRDVGLNPTRSYIIEVLKRMGARIEIEHTETAPEPCGTIVVESSNLRGVAVGGEEIPLLIDELPALACAALFAEGETTVRDASELRVKESDRIQAVVDMVRSFGGEADGRDDGFSVRGPSDIRSTVVKSCGDHRIAMAASVLALAAQGKSLVKDADCVAVSCPEFFDLLEKVAV
jgi:3-phosphoshikimate 1-carboxyvinyltransferase